MSKYFRTNGVLSTSNTLGGIVRPSLVMNFDNGERLNPLFSCIRNSIGTYYDGRTQAKAEENLMLQSQSLNLSPWSNDGVTITANSTVAPDGTTTADTIQISTGTSFKKVVGFAGVIQNLQYTFSTWVLAGTVSSVTLYSGGNIITSAVVLSGPAVAGATGGSGCTFTGLSSSVWSRISITVTASASGIVEHNIYPGNWNAQAVGNSVIAWGVQLEQRSVATTYTPTTTASITNYIPQLLTAPANTPRINHNPTTGETLGLLVEESRTNLLTYSEQFDNATWTKQQSSIINNTTVAPDGTTNADKLVEDTSTTLHRAFQQVGASIGTYTYSLYCKAAERTRVFVILSDNITGSIGAYVDLSAGTVVADTATVGAWTNISRSITPVGNGWYRVTVSGTTGGSMTSLLPMVYLSNGSSNNSTTTYTGTNGSGVFVWGAQLETGSFVTSYIPTVATQVTRNADLIKCTDVSWLHPSQGTLYAEATPFSTSTNPHPIFALTNNTSNTDNAIWLGRSINNTVTDAGFVIRSGGTEQARLYQSSSWLPGNKSRVAGSYKSAEIREASNAISASQASGGVPQVSICYIGSVNENLFFNGHINHVAYYPSTSTRFELEYLTNSTWR